MNSRALAAGCAHGGAADLGRCAQVPGDGPDRTSDALRALGAFAPAVALLDQAHQVVRWCSESFAQRTGVAAGDAWIELLARVPSMRAALDALSASPGPVDTPSAAVRAVRVAAGLVAVCLADPLPAGSAAQPALHDAEPALRTTRSLSMAELATTLAHEINQPLGAVVNVLHGLRGRLAEGGCGTRPPALAKDLRGAVELALEQALYAARLVSRHRQTTPDAVALVPLDPAEALQGALGLLATDIAQAGVAVAWSGAFGSSAAARWRVLGDALMLQQVFVNLVRNALEAMAGTPRVARRLDLELAEPGDRREWCLALRDSGCGCPAGRMETGDAAGLAPRPAGRGVGLGLCRAFLALHGGRLGYAPNDATARPGPGTTFHVCLPLQGPPPGDAVLLND